MQPTFDRAAPKPCRDMVRLVKNISALGHSMPCLVDNHAFIQWSTISLISVGDAVGTKFEFPYPMSIMNMTGYSNAHVEEHSPFDDILVFTDKSQTFNEFSVVKNGRPLAEDFISNQSFLLVGREYCSGKKMENSDGASLLEWA